MIENYAVLGQICDREDDVQFALYLMLYCLLRAIRKQLVSARLLNRDCLYSVPKFSAVKWRDGEAFVVWQFATRRRPHRTLRQQTYKSNPPTHTHTHIHRIASTADEENYQQQFLYWKSAYDNSINKPNHTNTRFGNSQSRLILRSNNIFNFLWETLVKEKRRAHGWNVYIKSFPNQDSGTERSEW